MSLVEIINSCIQEAKNRGIRPSIIEVDTQTYSVLKKEIANRLSEKEEMNRLIKMFPNMGDIEFQDLPVITDASKEYKQFYINIQED